MDVNYTKLTNYCEESDGCTISMGLIYQTKGIDPTTQLFAYFGGFHTSFNGGQSIPQGKTFFVMSADKNQSCYDYVNPTPTSLPTISSSGSPYSIGTIIVEIYNAYFNWNGYEYDPGLFKKVYDERH